MKESFRDYISIWAGIGSIVIALVAWGFPKGIIAAIIIAIAVILYHVIRKPQVVGTYDIVDAKNPQGKEYKGELKIEKWSEWLSCKWESREWASDAPKEINGIGLRVGKALAFSYEYTDSKDCVHIGIVHYKIKIDHLSGKCVEFGEPPHAGFEECKKQ